MPGDLYDLAERFEKKAAALDQKASNAAVAVALAIIDDLSYHTPVDTSQALSNWNVNLGSAATGTNGPHYPGMFGSTQHASAQETIAKAREILKNKKPGVAIHITNNLPYIVRLNDGYSKQVPAGFVERSVIVGRNALRNFKLKV